MPDAKLAVSAGPRLILITGAPASGKSRLTAALAQRHGAVCCSKDEIKESLFETLGPPADAGRSRALSDASFAILFALLPRLLGGHRLLLVDGNFRPGEHEVPLGAALAAATGGCAQVLCQAEPGLRAARLAERAHRPERHPGHRDGSGSAAPVPAPGFLALPGPRWVFDSGVPWAQAFEPLSLQVGEWVRPRQP